MTGATRCVTILAAALLVPVAALATASPDAAPDVANADPVKGKQLAENWGEYGGYACTGCHGGDYRGGSVAPSIAGRDPQELAKRLAAYRAGAVTGPNAGEMQAVAATMTDADIAALTAFLRTLPPK